VGYVALNANVIIDESINREKTKDLELSTLNLNGEFEAAKGTVKIELLETPNIIYKGRLFGRADYYIIPEADFRRDFPNMAYKSEDEYYNWKSTKIVFETAFDSKSDKKLLVIL
jgi:hypothetical protein